MNCSIWPDGVIEIWEVTQNDQIGFQSRTKAWWIPLTSCVNKSSLEELDLIDLPLVLTEIAYADMIAVFDGDRVRFFKDRTGYHGDEVEEI